jgi:hypothetical protein
MKIAVALAFIIFVATARAAPPPGETPNPELHAWFESLRQPGSHELCCSISDCRFTPVWRRDHHYEIGIDGWRYTVQDRTILSGTHNPTGQAIACYKYIAFNPALSTGVTRAGPQDEIEITCFIPPEIIS